MRVTAPGPYEVVAGVECEVKGDHEAHGEDGKMNPEHWYLVFQRVCVRQQGR